MKLASHQYWDKISRESCTIGRIFKILKCLANRETSHGDNVLCNPHPVVSAHLQAEAFLHYFQHLDTFESLPFDLCDGDCFLDACISLEDLSHALKCTRPTYPGANGISVWLLQHLNSVDSQKLLAIYNASFQSSILPDSWKLATIIPIRKPGKPTKHMSSYRPIALSSV